jgi:ferredoxin/flavodoxin---NADP+ reductase
MPKHEPNIPAKLAEKIDLDEGLAIFRFTLASEFHFDPGQYATLWLTHKGKTIPRPYSIASSPTEPWILEFYINLVAEGKLTPSLWDPEVLESMKAGSPDTELFVTGPRGRFRLDPQDSRDLVFVASGTGLAPFVSMIRKFRHEYAVDPDSFTPRRIILIHGASFASHLAYRDELESLARESLRDPAGKLSLIYLPTLSRPSLEPYWRGLRGRAETVLEPACKSFSLEETVRGMLGMILRPETHAVYVCGHPGTIDNTVAILAKRGFKPELDIKREKYYP